VSAATLPGLAPSGPYVYVQPGHLAVSLPAEPRVLSTVLGSCVAVCLWDSRGRLGGMNHYLLPQLPARAAATARYGTVAVPALIEELLRFGASRLRLRAKVFGGAQVLATAEGGDHLGARNVEVALRALAVEGVQVMAGDVGGGRGRRLLFEAGSGQAWVRLL
jgi:chemotaxis protein CheD